MIQAWELCHLAEIRLTPQGRSLVDAHLTVRQYFDRLMEHDCYADARRVLAHALPKRRALWWGCISARDLYGPVPPPDVAEVLEVVSHYAEHGDELSRRQAEAIGMEFGPNQLTCCLAMAAFFSGDNVSRPDLPAVAPHPFVTARLVEVVVYLASVRKDPRCYLDPLRRYLEQGLQISLGQDPWLVPDASPMPGVPVASPTAHGTGVAS